VTLKDLVRLVGYQFNDPRILGDTPMAMLKDITQVLPRLKLLVLLQDEAIKKII